MTNAYRWVQWNKHKKTYDLLAALLVAGFIAVYVIASSVALGRSETAIAPPVLLMRALALSAFVLLHLILCIGPLARLSNAWAPLLYNRRHLGVMFFLLAALHALIAIGFYGGFGVRDPITATLAGYGSFGAVSSFPFEVVGLLALLIFFVMAATSHDFWLKNLGPRTWKTLHMLVYVGYGLVVTHVALGALQSETSPLLAGLLLAGVMLVGGLHLAAGIVQTRRDSEATKAPSDAGWLEVAQLGAFEDGRAKIVHTPDGESIAVFRDGGRLCAIANRCAHQGGPLGEGQVVDGCITCPWHGYQYRPEDGKSPPPYTEQVPTYEVRVQGGAVSVAAEPSPLSSPAAPVELPSDDSSTSTGSPDA